MTTYTLANISQATVIVVTHAEILGLFFTLANFSQLRSQ